MNLLLRRPGLAVRLSVALLATALATACHSGASSEPTPHPPPITTDRDTVRFDGSGTLELKLDAPAVLRVTASPPKAYSVEFTLLGASLDASLDANVVATDGQGSASVKLTAPSQATTFNVRATLIDGDGIPGPSAEQAVAVSDQGFGTIRVQPQYLGMRKIGTYTASVVAKATCKDLAKTLPADPPGGLMATAPYGKDPSIVNVPVGPELAVTLRAGHFAWGCASAPSLTAGATVDVPVTVVDKPLDLAAADLGATFTYSPDPLTYAMFLGDAVNALDDAFMPTGTPEGTIVLNAMEAHAVNQAAFTQARAGQSWDSVAQQHFDGLGQGLHDTCAAWAAAGVALQPTSFDASLVAGTQPGQVVVAVTQLGSLDPTTAGAAAPSTCTWSAQAGDIVSLSGAVYFEPSRFAGACSLGPALLSQPSASTVSGALAIVADCQGLAAALGPFGNCDVGCVADLCATALSVRWQAALDASKQASALGQVAFEVSASAHIDDVAVPTSLGGNWLGKLGDATVVVPVKGAMSATTTAPVPFMPP